MVDVGFGIRLKKKSKRLPGLDSTFDDYEIVNTLVRKKKKRKGGKK